MYRSRSGLRLVGLLLTGVLVVGLWTPVQARAGKHCDPAEEGQRNTRGHGKGNGKGNGGHPKNKKDKCDPSVPPSFLEAIGETLDDGLATLQAAIDDELAGAPGLPNLVPDVQTVALGSVTGLGPELGTLVTTGPWLFFDTHAQNLGDYAVDLLIRTDGLPQPLVSQCVAWSTKYKYVCTERREVGGFVFHTEHAHFHYEDFATYELRSLLTDGTPDWSAGGLIASSPKVSFCLMDTQRVEDDADEIGTYNVCQPARQGISPGWTDVYTSELEGQALPVFDIVDGRYALVVRMDPDNRLYETDHTDNQVVVILEISGDVQTVQIVERRR